MAGAVKSLARGFTLVELLVVMAIAAILLGIAVPSFKSFTSAQRVKTATGDFVNAAVLARSEAIKRSADVGLYAEAGGWKSGWNIKKGTDVLGTQAAFQGLDMTNANGVTQFVYGKDGRMKEPTTASDKWLQVVGADNKPRCVSFDLSGLPRIRMGSCS